MAEAWIGHRPTFYCRFASSGFQNYFERKLFEGNFIVAQLGIMENFASQFVDLNQEMFDPEAIFRFHFLCFEVSHLN